MQTSSYDSLSKAINGLTQKGFTEHFSAEEAAILGSQSKRSYAPEDLKIVKTFRFDGMTNPQDDSVVFAIEAKDGTRGTLVMSYGSKQGQNVELIKNIPSVTD